MTFAAPDHTGVVWQAGLDPAVQPGKHPVRCNKAALLAPVDPARRNTWMMNNILRRRLLAPGPRLEWLGPFATAGGESIGTSLRHLPQSDHNPASPTTVQLAPAYNVWTAVCPLA